MYCLPLLRVIYGSQSHCPFFFFHRHASTWLDNGALPVPRGRPRRAMSASCSESPVRRPSFHYSEGIFFPCVHSLLSQGLIGQVFRVVGKEAGHAHSYGHCDILCGMNADKEVNGDFLCLQYVFIRWSGFPLDLELDRHLRHQARPCVMIFK
jgi:hypothetical protein